MNSSFLPTRSQVHSTHPVPQVPAVKCWSFKHCPSLRLAPKGLDTKERECAIVDHRTISKPTVFN